ncbi:MAG: hypothetical protein NZ516_02865 [Raineya sp.]|nr:hypothetical protein [Raineya sp.]
MERLMEVYAKEGHRYFTKNFKEKVFDFSEPIAQYQQELETLIS